ncbi:hypothetical protein H257_00143 [Aphanomyces astaci]|uniref:Prokaryotic-type class I peptide chain release factors domain-containing protein n=1 Tax=Aphanomyces astaci TaxID=112090 RepID=W4HAL8_APHAT|nr:hypothetical protein H257_00143 [Aphanomyces astaci]ETV88591.1 hypothetical protein H257_00143 [Aphanomyces astaci]RQM28729.1 hypothetical protein B5M09_008131 [Aphanomyces astaci]|eukprot:XP_009820991.1 hypothetical protein H257_00143 [Aphanomyces astaci]
MLHMVRRASSLPGCRPTQTILRANETNGGHIVGTFRTRLSSSWGKVLTSKVVVIDENDLEEKFVKGSGNGGQKINKVRNSVFLKHTPTGVFVQCQKTRSLDDNRRVARKLLHAKLDDLVNGTTSKRNVKIQLAQKKKAKKKAKSRQKHLGGTAKQASSGDDELLSNDDVDDDDESSDEDDVSADKPSS